MNIRRGLAALAAFGAIGTGVGACTPAPAPPITSGTYDLMVGQCHGRAFITPDAGRLTIVKNAPGCRFAVGTTKLSTTSPYGTSWLQKADWSPIFVGDLNANKCAWLTQAGAHRGITSHACQ